MAKPKNYDEAVTQLDAAKEKLSSEKEALRTFKKDNKIKRNKPVEDEAIAKKLATAEGKVEKAREAVDAIKEIAKELKPRKDRVTKYEYPEDCISDQDKKKYRAKMRRDAKKAESGEKEGEKPAAETKKPVKKVVKKSSEKED